MPSPLANLGVTLPLLAAPMAGGPSTPALVVAAAKAGGIGFLAAGYKTPALLAEQISAVRSQNVPFGVNVFAPNPVPVEPAAYAQYARAIQAEGERYGLDLTPAAGSEPVEDDDEWGAKIDLLLAEPVPLVSFTFAIPTSDIIDPLRRVGTLVIQTVTSAEEARAATEARADLLAVQASAAGGHSGTLTPERIAPPTPVAELLAEVRAVSDLPLLAAGGLATSSDIAAVLHAGAEAAVVGTGLLLAEECGTSAAYRSALAEPGSRRSLVTRAFTGRPARALSNEFTERYDSIAPHGYPAIHHLTSPLRRAAAAANDPERINIWAGAGFRHAKAAPAAELFADLAGKL